MIYILKFWGAKLNEIFKKQFSLIKFWLMHHPLLTSLSDQSYSIYVVKFRKKGSTNRDNKYRDAYKSK